MILFSEIFDQKPITEKKVEKKPEKSKRKAKSTHERIQAGERMDGSFEEKDEKTG